MRRRISALFVLAMGTQYTLQQALQELSLKKFQISCQVWPGRLHCKHVKGDIKMSLSEPGTIWDAVKVFFGLIGVTMIMVVLFLMFSGGNKEETMSPEMQNELTKRGYQHQLKEELEKNPTQQDHAKIRRILRSLERLKKERKEMLEGRKAKASSSAAKADAKAKPSASATLPLDGTLSK